jgi:peptidoglycan hydrolase-like protein with peptidoglycan-binding domain
LRRLALLTIAAPLVLAPAAAQAQAPADLTASVVGLHQGKATYVVAHTKVRVAGTINAAAAGDGVTVELLKNGKVRKRQLAGVNKDGKFAAKLPVAGTGTYAVQVVHKQGVNVGAAQTKRIRFTAVRSNLHQGSSGPAVRLLQRQLARLAYVTPRNGRYSSATARAVLAYRKVNHMARIGSVNRAVLAKLFSGRGGFALRHPGAGRHVEADLTRQVLVLADHGKAQRIYHTSSGKPSTPTVVGSFRFYRRGPGYNAEGMYFSTYFIRGYAIHGYASVPTYAASHGCLRVNLQDAIGIYKRLSLGERIFVYQKGKGSTRVMPNAGP